MTLKYSVFPEDNVVLDHFALKAPHKEILQDRENKKV